jgi:hypothetical protein
MPLTAAKRRLFILGSMSEVADFFGVTEPAVRQRWMPAGMPKFEPEKGVKPGESQYRFPADQIITWLITEGPWRRRVDPADRAVREVDTQPPADASPDPMMAAPVNSPAMERYRTAKAKLAEIEVDEKQRQIGKISSLRVVLIACLGRLNKEVEALDRTSVMTGREAAIRLREAIADFADIAERSLKENAGIVIGSIGSEPTGSVPPGDVPNVAPPGQTDQPMGGTGNHGSNGGVCGEPVPPLAPSGQQDLVQGA